MTTPAERTLSSGAREHHLEHHRDRLLALLGAVPHPPHDLAPGLGGALQCPMSGRPGRATFRIRQLRPEGRQGLRDRREIGSVRVRESLRGRAESEGITPAELLRRAVQRFLSS